MDLYNIVCQVRNREGKVRDKQDEMFASSPQDAENKFILRWSHKYTVEKVVQCDILVAKNK